MAPANKKARVLIIGGQFTGGFTGRELKKNFNVTIVDAKEYFEYTPGVLRAFVKPAHFDALSFTLQPVYERKMGVKFIWGEVLSLDGQNKKAEIQPMFLPKIETVSWDYCVVCAGCNFGPFHKWGESLWFPTIHNAARPEGSWAHIDERFIEGRRRHILEEFEELSTLDRAAKEILIVGAGFIGVEWITEIEHYFPNCKLTIIDGLPRPLGPLPDAAAEYCEEYMDASGIKQFYKTFFAATDPEFWKKIELPNGIEKGAVKSYVCIGVKASNYFMPEETLYKPIQRAGWIHVNRYMQVTHEPKNAEACKDNGGNPEDPSSGCLEGAEWAGGDVFAVGDCNVGWVGYLPAKDDKGKPKKLEDGKLKVPACYVIPPIPKISYPGEEQAMHACVNLKIKAMKDGKLRRGTCAPCFAPTKMKSSWWPWGAGMFATSLGPHDACFVVAANENPQSGYMVNWWYPAAIQKEIIETTKVDEMKDNCIGILIWHFVHHTPVNCFGRGPCVPCQCCPVC